MIADNPRTSKQGDPADRALLADVDSILRDADGLRSVEVQDLGVSAEAGVISLRGHVDNQTVKREAERLSAAVTGVKGIHNALVVDPDLATAVARALAADASTRASIFRVGASAGWIQLGGDAPNMRVRAAARIVAGGVPAVRGVLSLPHVAGEAATRLGRRVQPQIGTAAYASDGELGEVVGVIIDPHDRLVTHVIVHARLNPQWPEEDARGQFAIPVSVVSMSTIGGTMVTESMAAVSARPRFHDADFAWPPGDWQSPFPYRAGEVHWSAQRQETAT